MYFIRLIWRESAFRPNVVSHKGAQGIAQFMPATAKERGLDNAFDPISAISHSARLLADHSKVFGNFGLAAAAYNAGAERVRAWLDGRSALPAETRAYVHFVTGQSVGLWKEAGAGRPAEASELSSAPLQDSCRKRAPALVHVALPGQQPGSGPAPSPSPWGVQLAPGFSQTKVARLLDKLKRRPMFVAERNLSRARRAMVALRIGTETREGAPKLSPRPRVDGGICTVEKNWKSPI